tara:strand:- start:530 stop:832 length:303 start_codon:yes stop_codon:yes gene_type:complete
MDTDCGDHPSSQAYDLPLMAGAIAILRAGTAWRATSGSPALPEILDYGMGGTLLSPALQGQQYCGFGHGDLLVRWWWWWWWCRKMNGSHTFSLPFFAYMF